MFPDRREILDWFFFLYDSLFFLLLFFAMLLCMGANVFLSHPIVSIHLLLAVGSIALLFILYKILDTKLD